MKSFSSSLSSHLSAFYSRFTLRSVLWSVNPSPSLLFGLRFPLMSQAFSVFCAEGCKGLPAATGVVALHLFSFMELRLPHHLSHGVEARPGAFHVRCWKMSQDAAFPPYRLRAGRQAQGDTSSDREWSLLNSLSLQGHPEESNALSGYLAQCSQLASKFSQTPRDSSPLVLGNNLLNIHPQG